MTKMVVYDCQSCSSHSARRLHEMPWKCDKCGTVVAVGSDRDVMIVDVPDAKVSGSNFKAPQSYTYEKEIFTERGIEAYEKV